MMRILDFRSRRMRSILTTIMVVSGSVLSFSAVAEKTDLPEVDKDGLHLLKNSAVAIAYARPGANLASYSKVKILDCFVDFQKDWQRDYNMREIGLEGRVTDKDAEKIKQRLATEFNKVFTDVLNKNGHEIVEENGPDVLLLRPALINVDVVAPDIMRAGMQRTLIRSAGAMTLYMELYDSATSTLIARVVDPQADDQAFTEVANRVTNKAAADKILQSWADLLSTHLGTVKNETTSK